MNQFKRTHMCAEVSERQNGQAVTVMGWAHNARKLGQLIFIALRDRSGILQLKFDEEAAAAEVFETARQVKGEYVIAATGLVALRSEKDINPDMETGKIEVIVDRLEILNEAETPPFQIASEGVGEELRLKYRYLDLRRKDMQRNFLVRHKLCQAIREFYSNEGFIEVETPCLTKGTPEGAKEYLVPSRLHPGNFYVLPQSPQQFKQLLMVGGIDKYFQIARCFRDEDNRADRQPEFTQLDVEMSFVDQEDVLQNTENMLRHIFKKAIDFDVPPIPRMTYKEAFERFGTDRPDLRYGMEIINISELAKGTDFNVFQAAEAAGSSVRGILCAGQAGLPRKQQDRLQDVAKSFGAKGLMFIEINEAGEMKSSVSKFLSEEKLREIADGLGMKNGDLAMLCAGADKAVLTALGGLRCDMADKMDIIPKNVYKFLWVIDMPLLEYDEENDKWDATHHLFTSPMDEDIPMLESNPGECRAKQYDVVINGFEIGSGSIRIHKSELQTRIFKLLGISDEDVDLRFGHMLAAFRYGAPPHGGVALGIDRIAALMTGEKNIREVIAFPKTKEGYCPLTSAPNTVSERQLGELKIQILEDKD